MTSARLEPGRPWRWLAAVALGLGAAAVLSAAVSVPGAGETAAAGPLASAPTAAGLRAFVDPEHGGVRAPTAAEMAAVSADLAAKLSRSSEGLTVVKHPDGRKSVDLQGRFQSVSVATIGADGRPRVECLQDAGEAAARLSGEPAASREEVR